MAPWINTSPQLSNSLPCPSSPPLPAPASSLSVPRPSNTPRLTHTTPEPTKGHLHQLHPQPARSHLSSEIPSSEDPVPPPGLGCPVGFSAFIATIPACSQPNSILCCLSHPTWQAETTSQDQGFSLGGQVVRGGTLGFKKPERGDTQTLPEQWTPGSPPQHPVSGP